jgi:hypothetical protein
MIRRIPAVLAIFLLSNSASAELVMFWQDGGNQAILRAKADGRNVQTIVNTAADGTGLAIYLLVNLAYEASLP